MKKVWLGLRSPIFSTVARSSRKSSTSFFCRETQEVSVGLKMPQELKEELSFPFQRATAAMEKSWGSPGDKSSLKLLITTWSQGEVSDRHSDSRRYYHFMCREVRAAKSHTFNPNIKFLRYLHSCWAQSWVDLVPAPQSRVGSCTFLLVPCPDEMPWKDPERQIQEQDEGKWSCRWQRKKYISRYPGLGRRQPN